MRRFDQFTKFITIKDSIEEVTFIVSQHFLINKVKKNL